VLTEGKQELDVPVVRDNVHATTKAVVNTLKRLVQESNKSINAVNDTQRRADANLQVGKLRPVKLMRGLGTAVKHLVNGTQHGIVHRKINGTVQCMLFVNFTACASPLTAPSRFLLHLLLIKICFSIAYFHVT